MKWRVYLEMLGASAEHAEKQVGITDTAAFCQALLNGRILRVHGIGKRGYRLLALAADYPLPVWKGEKLVATCGQVLAARYAGGKGKETQYGDHS